MLPCGTVDTSKGTPPTLPDRTCFPAGHDQSHRPLGTRVSSTPARDIPPDSGIALHLWKRTTNAIIRDSLRSLRKLPVAKKIDNIPREVFDASKSKRKKYQNLVIGRSGWWPLFCYEIIITFASRMPGALGLFLRSKLYPVLLGACGRNVFFGADITLRHPHKIRIGDDVVIDDGCVLDAKGSSNQGISIGNGVFLGRQTSINTKDGNIVLEDGVNISSFCMVFSASHVQCGKDTLIAAYTYLVGGGHAMGDTGTPIIEQERPSVGITIGPNGWIGAGVSILDGVTLGHDVVVGANSVVTDNVDDFAIVAGSPATVKRIRQPPSSGR